MGPAGEQRKVVTIVFADVVGSTSLAAQRDPEVVRSLMSRYFKRVAEIAEAYGGTVEKFAGDAVMVVFGVPVVHDDDAERAVRAALEIRDGATNLAVRVGVNTGEAVTAATDDKQFMVSGDAVNVAARLQQGAGAGDVVVGELTEQLTRNVIDYEASEPIIAKGKPEPVVAFHALRARSQVPVQARGVPGLHAALVGRNRELRLLLETFARAAEDRTPHLFTVVGAPGIGKSRLVAEAVTALADSGARVLHGRCLPYGRGITYWPLVEMLRLDTGISLSDERDKALMKLERWLGELLSDDPQRTALRARLSVMLGLETAEAVMPDTPADRVEREIAWAVRHYMQAVARAAPLILVFDDVQWAELPVLAIVEQLVERVTDAPLVVLCVARPEFLETSRGWSAGKPNATTITLDPLSPDETSTLISRLLEIEGLPQPLRNQIIERSAGTPLFCEEFIHMVIDEGLVVREGATWRATTSIDEIHVPHSVQAVLAARLDLLPHEERSVLQAASVIGQRFALPQVEGLVENTEVVPNLDSLRRKGLVAGGDDPDEEFRFRHLLIRDAAYASLPKTERASLHDRFQSVLEAESGDPLQIAEILAHHAERSFTLSRELDLDDALVAERANHALRWLLVMADRARTRNDVWILEGTLETLHAVAEALPNGGGSPVRARLRLLESQLLVMKADYRGAQAAASEAASLAEQASLPALVATARITEAWIWNWSGGEGVLDHLDELTDSAIEAARRAGDVSAEIEARHIASNKAWATGHLDEFVAINRDLFDQARSIGDDAHTAAILNRLLNAELMRGNVDLAKKYLAEADVLATELGLREVAINLLRHRGHILRLEGDSEGAQELFRQIVTVAEDAGTVFQQVTALRWIGFGQLENERFAEAALTLDRALELSEAIGETWNRTELLALRARAALGSAEIDVADHFIERAVETLRSTDIAAIAEVHQHLGMIRHAQQRDVDAEASLRKAVDAVGSTEYRSLTISTALDLALFLTDQERNAEAEEILNQYAELAHSFGWHEWDEKIARIQSVVKADIRSDT
jgi:class 3 adenylate cyclase/tetratricopeptide (TPR) repeat protein